MDHAMPAGPDDWKAEQDAHTLAQAREIEADGVRLAKARAAAHRKASAMAAVAAVKADTGADQQLQKGFRKIG